jgi:hypothetical protein
VLFCSFSTPESRSSFFFSCSDFLFSIVSSSFRVVVSVPRSAAIFGPCAQYGDPIADLVSLPAPSLCPLRFPHKRLHSVTLVLISRRVLFCHLLNLSPVSFSSVRGLFSSCCLFWSCVERTTRPQSAPPVAPSWSLICRPALMIFSR